jgi:HD superfamily phosphodiesterase
MKLSKRELQVFEWAKKFYEAGYEKIDRAHEWDHILRVLYNMFKIQKVEGGDLRVLIPAVFLHDIGQAEDDSNGQTEHAMLSAKRAPEILAQIGYNKEEVAKICETIELHSTRFTSKKEMTLEGKVIFDADKMDAVGLSLILRYAKNFYWQGHRQLAQHTIDLFNKWHKKRGGQIFYTETGKKMGSRQIKEAEKFSKKVIKEENQMDKFLSHLFTK